MQVGLSLIYPSIVSSTSSCQVYPSEYAYRDDSVSKAESTNANCRGYPLPHAGYVLCDGRQLKLADSDLGREQYRSSDYYVWSAGSDGRLLLIFPTRVSLTTITLHYYSDSDRGLPRLRFYAVRDNFNVWNASIIGKPHVKVAAISPSGGQQAGRRNVSINIKFYTKKLLMYKDSSSFQFALSEVEFFLCNGTHTGMCLGLFFLSKCKI